MKDGIWKSFYKDLNTISFKGSYVQGSPDGKHEYYYPDGILQEEQYYESGEKVKSWSKYDKNGKEYKINGVKVKLDQDDY